MVRRPHHLPAAAAHPIPSPSHPMCVVFVIELSAAPFTALGPRPIIQLGVLAGWFWEVGQWRRETLIMLLPQ